MIDDFRIVHRPKPHVFAAAQIPIWETCLRSIAFASDLAGESTDEALKGVEAYKFLLEVICGLHSPIIGETEVFGQFKNFARSWSELDPSRRPLIQRLLNEAKEIRTGHLHDLGAQSYGGWLKRKVTSSRLHIIGAGHLAKEIVPHLAKSAQVIVHVRDPRKVDLPGVDLRSLQHRKFDGGGLVIAAPLAASEIHGWLGGSQVEEVFDLRGNSASDRIVGFNSIYVLHDIFSELEQTKARLAPLVDTVKAEIAGRGLRLATQPLMRPLGWDDLCA